MRPRSALRWERRAANAESAQAIRTGWELRSPISGGPARARRLVACAEVEQRGELGQATLRFLAREGRPQPATRCHRLRRIGVHEAQDLLPSGELALLGDALLPDLLLTLRERLAEPRRPVGTRFAFRDPTRKCRREGGLQEPPRRPEDEGLPRPGATLPGGGPLRAGARNDRRPGPRRAPGVGKYW